MALLAQRHRHWGCMLVLQPQTSNVAWKWGSPSLAPFAALLRKCECLQIAGRQKGLAWRHVAHPHLPMALVAQRHRDWGCLLVLPPQNSNIDWQFRGSLLASLHITAAKMQTSANSWQAEGASLESCCSASFAYGTGRTEAQTLGLLACLATSNIKRILEGPCPVPPAALLGKR